MFNNKTTYNFFVEDVIVDFKRNIVLHDNLSRSSQQKTRSSTNLRTFTVCLVTENFTYFVDCFKRRF